VIGDVPFDVYVGLGLRIVPQTAVIHEGIVRTSWAGAVDPQSVVAAVQTVGGSNLWTR
jgi:hypothetical protein